MLGGRSKGKRKASHDECRTMERLQRVPREGGRTGDGERLLRFVFGYGLLIILVLQFHTGCAAGLSSGVEFVPQESDPASHRVDVLRGWRLTCRCAAPGEGNLRGG